MAVMFSNRGIYKKYEVMRLDGEVDPDNADYFIIRVDKDSNDSYAKVALLAYSYEVKKKFPVLSACIASLARNKDFVSFKLNKIPPKYAVRKTEGNMEGASAYFVFLLNDPDDSASRIAIRRYAEAIETEAPRLSKDLQELIQKYENQFSYQKENPDKTEKGA
jgi:hypothetical protein